MLLAPACAACTRLLEQPTRGCVCPSCWADVTRLTPPLCERCGDPLPVSPVSPASQVAQAAADAILAPAPQPARPATGALPDLHNNGNVTNVPPAALCVRCRRAPRALDRGRAAGLYEGSLRAIVHAFKYGGRRSLARPLGALMRQQAGDLLAGAAWTVPVPLHWRRARQRGFNQAADLARTLGPPVLHALRRVRATVPQADLPAARRHRNVRDAFALRGRGAGSRARARLRRALDGACVVLVDDVSTTGATLEACARTLKAAGVREVRAVTAARVVTRPPRRSPPAPPHAAVRRR